MIQAPMAPDASKWLVKLYVRNVVPHCPIDTAIAHGLIFGVK
jgi:hypothetical protein